MDLRQRYEQALHNVQKPLRYVGGEWNAAVKESPSVRSRVALIFPDMYEIGTSYLGYRILYDLLNKRADIAAERVFSPWVDLEEELRKAGLPLLSLETHRPLKEFEVLGFTLQYELCYTNILTILDLSGIPLRTAKRTMEDPLVIAGGPVAVNPEPIADFIDLFLIGDGEEAFFEIIDEFHTSRQEFREGKLASRAEALKRLARIQGAYVPSLYEACPDPGTGLLYVVPREEGVAFPVRRRALPSLDPYPFPDSPIVPHAEIVHDRISVEIARGCMEGCRFCQAGYIYRPLRERKPKDILRCVEKSLENTGYDEVSLTALSTADYSCFAPMVKELMPLLERKNVALSVASLKAPGLTRELAEEIKKVRQTGFTIAPEGGSQRMRDVVNKNITEEHVLSASRAAFETGWDLIKLYFMIGLPTETEDDVHGIVDLAEKVVRLGREIKRQRGEKAPRVHLSASSFVPKPFTPYQWAAMDDVETLKLKQRRIRGRIEDRNIRFKYHHAESSWLEGILSRGDRRLCAVIENAWRKGCRFDGWTEMFRYEVWTQALAEEGLNPDAYLRAVPEESRLPWDHLDILVEKAFLLREWQRSLQVKVTPPCGKLHPKFIREVPNWAGSLVQISRERKPNLVCYDCGTGCDLEETAAAVLENAGSLAEGAQATAPQSRPDRLSDPHRYRAAFAKIGILRFASQVDLGRLLTRGFSRAEVPLKYSEGYHPAPQISFGPALAVGIDSPEEYFDFVTERPLLLPEALDKLNAASPADFCVTAIAPLAGRGESLFQIIDTTVYAVDLDTPGVETWVRSLGVPHRDVTQIHQTLVDHLLQRTQIIITREQKGKIIQKDIRPYIRDVRLRGSAGTSRWELILELAMGPEGTARPEEVLRELYHRPASSRGTDLFRVRRERLLCHRDGQPCSPLEVVGEVHHDERIDHQLHPV